MAKLTAPEIAKLLRELSARMELEGGNPYRARAYSRAAENLSLQPGYTNPIYRYPLYQRPPDRCAGPFAVGKPEYPPGLSPVAERQGLLTGPPRLA